jgi:hypothetical protein
MAKDLDIAVVVKSVLDAKGFDQAQTKLGQLAGKAAPAKKATEALGNAAKKTGTDMGFLGARMSTLTQEVFRWAGMGQHATAVGTGMSSSFSGIGNAAKFMGVGIGIATIAISFLAPLIIKWWNATKVAREEQERLREAMLGVLDNLRAYITDIPTASAVIREWAAALQVLALEKQIARIGELTKSIAENEAKVKDLTETKYAEIEVDQAGNALQAQTIHATKEQLAEADKLSKQIRVETAERRALIEAKGKEVTLAQQMAADRRAEQARRSEQARDIAQRRIEMARYTAQQEKQIAADIAYDDSLKKMAKDQSRDADRDIRDETRRQTAHAREMMAIDSEQTLAHIRNRQEIAKIEEWLAEVRRNMQMDQISAWAQATTAFAGIFGQNKAINIAAALIDTYAAANKALNQYPGPPYTIPFAALAVAAGLANVARIKEAEVGFDDPFSDLIARKLGRRSASDFVAHFGGGFREGMGGGAVTNNYVRNTTNRGTSIQNFNATGLFGANRTQVMKALKRELIVADRLEARTAFRAGVQR